MYRKSIIESDAGWSCIRLSDGPNIKQVELFKFVGAGLILICCLVIRGSTGGFLLLQNFSGVVSHPKDVSVESLSLTHHRPYS